MVQDYCLVGLLPHTEGSLTGHVARTYSIIVSSFLVITHYCD